MDKSLERTLGRKVVKATAKNMKPFSYTLTKPTFLCREFPHLIAFFHFHKYRFGPCFRVHLGIRVLNSSFEAQHLNGPSLHPKGEYGSDDISFSSYVQTLTELLIRDGLPWIESWLDPRKLISDADSPLQKDERADLHSALDTKPDSERIAMSYSLFGMTPPNTALEPTATAPCVSTMI